jgi:hypothetical protein
MLQLDCLAGFGDVGLKGGAAPESLPPGHLNGHVSVKDRVAAQIYVAKTAPAKRPDDLKVADGLSLESAPCLIEKASWRN